MIHRKYVTIENWETCWYSWVATKMTVFFENYVSIDGGNLNAQNVCILSKSNVSWFAVCTNLSENKLVYENMN